jgi:hypothetical protein
VAVFDAVGGIAEHLLDRGSDLAAVEERLESLGPEARRLWTEIRRSS